MSTHCLFDARNTIDNNIFILLTFMKNYATNQLKLVILILVCLCPLSTYASRFSTYKQNETLQREGDRAVWIHLKFGPNELSNIFGRHPGAFVMIDGKESTREELTKRHKKLKTVIEYNSYAASIKYGEMGRNGVIMGTTYKPLQSIVYKPDGSMKKAYMANTKKNLVYINGREITSERDIDLAHKNIDRVYLTEVKRNKATLTEKYGSKIDGKSKVIDISIKDNSDYIDNDEFVSSIHQVYNDNEDVDIQKAFIIIDGKKSTPKELEMVDPYTISTMKVLKDREAIAAYGIRGKQGVILVTTNDNEAIPNLASADTNISSINRLHLNGKELAPEALVVIDNQEITYSQYKNYPIGEIESMTVLNSDIATKDYGDRARHGVIVIASKNKNR